MIRVGQGRWALFAGIGLLAIVPSVSGSMALWSRTSDLAATYTCRGSNPDGTAYVLTMRTRPTGGGVYHLRWLSEDSLVFVGIGIRLDDHLAVMFRNAAGALAVAAYRVTRHTLEGPWTGGDMTVHVERCTARPEKG